MANLFNAAEIIDMGIEKEKKRRDFYGLVASKFTDKELKGLFTSLRNWEDEHVQKFSDIKKGLSQSETTESYPGELVDYINALVDDKIYADVTPEKFSVHITTPLSAINYGIGFEKDAILFFNELKQYIPEKNKWVVDKLIEEEKQHLIYLSKLRMKYT